MKLRNKRTGEIVEAHNIDLIGNIYLKIFRAGDYDTKKYNSLAELNEEWEDYEEPKGYWYYDTTSAQVDKLNHNEDKEIDSSIGNCFETKEEAEKAVEKLKAWKRLKDKGFRFVGRSIRDLTITYSFDNYDEPDIPQMNEDLDLLF